MCGAREDRDEIPSSASTHARRDEYGPKQLWHRQEQLRALRLRSCSAEKYVGACKHVASGSTPCRTDSKGEARAFEMPSGAAKLSTSSTCAHAESADQLSVLSGVACRSKTQDPPRETPELSKRTRARALQDQGEGDACFCARSHLCIRNTISSNGEKEGLSVAPCAEKSTSRVLLHMFDLAAKQARLRANFTNA
eukprot:6191290-Pleurochrysis_carterae.AAC.4